jgi:dolichol-phosphate mannosyltransferase
MIKQVKQKGEIKERMDQKKTTYSIILPTYNEKDNLPIIIWLIMKHMSESGHEFEVVIVDDNSPDGTKQIALDLQKIYGEKRIIVTGREKKLGLGSFNNIFNLKLFNT